MNTFSLSDEEVCYVISALHAATFRSDLTRLDREFSQHLRDKFASRIRGKLDPETIQLLEGST